MSMIWDRLETSPAVRSFVRRSGLKTLIESLHPPAAVYERKFGAALLAAVRSGDVVWDVGANIGHYTQQLARAVGETGQVICFEPVTSTHARLVAGLKRVGCRNAVPYQVALGSHESDVPIRTTTAADGVTNSLVSVGAPPMGTHVEVVHVVRGDLLVATGVPSPQVLKVDVEAFEEDVLFGLRDTLRSASCRAVFCEVHFGQLERRGFRRAPLRIESLLRDLGFAVRWVDSSHLQALRR